jgi:hypothetical protein
LSPILGIIASQNYVRIPPTSFESIATVNVSSTVSSVSFSSIPSTYKHLQIRYIARDNAGTAGADDMFISFNSGASAQYSWHRLIGDGASAAASGAASQSILAVSAAAISRGGNAANIFSTGIIDILDYQNTNKNTTTRELYGEDRNGAGQMGFGSGLWYGSTNAVTDITFTIESARSFVQYSQFALYGIKG